MTPRPPHAHRAPPGELRGFLGRIRDLASIARFVARTPGMPEEEVAAAMLAHLAEHGRTRSYELYRLFERSNDLHLDGKATAETPGFVSIGLVYVVLERLEEEGRVYGQQETFEGRKQVFWSLNPWGGTRRRAGQAESADMPSGAVAGTSHAREGLH